MGACGFEQIVAFSVPVECLDAQFAQKIDVVGIVVDHGDFNLLRTEQASDEVAETADSGEDDRRLFVHGIGLASVGFLGAESRSQHLFLKDHDQRSERHGEGDAGDEDLSQAAFQHPLGDPEAE